MIDCPGSSDPRGIDQDNKNTDATAKFLAGIKDVSAFCVVIKNSINRTTVEERYGVEQLKSLIPQHARDRIFIIATHDDMSNENISSFAYSLNLPVDNIFYFDNFALTREGHVDLIQLDFPMEDSDEIAEPFAALEINAEALNKIAIAKKVKSTWLKSHREFNRMLKSARAIGKCEIGCEMNKIYSLKRIITEKTLECYKIADSVGKVQLLLEVIRRERDDTDLSAKWAEDAYTTAHNVYQTAFKSMEEAIFAWRREGQFNFESKKAIQVVIDLRRGETNVASEKSSGKYEEKNQKRKDATLKNENYCRIVAQADALQNAKTNLYNVVIGNYKDLAKVSMGSLYECLIDYYDIHIRKEENQQQKEKLYREKQVYMELFELYQR